MWSALGAAVATELSGIRRRRPPLRHRAPPPAPRLVEGDRRHPRRERVQLLAALRSHPRSHQRLLHRILGGGVAPGRKGHGVHHARVVARQEPADLGFVRRASLRWFLARGELTVTDRRTHPGRDRLSSPIVSRPRTGTGYAPLAMPPAGPFPLHGPLRRPASRAFRLASASLAALVTTLCLAAPAIAQEEDPPSILLIVTDDQRWDTLWSMPEVQRSLVERGVTFSESFTTSSLCCPSRASILTGQYPHTTGVYRQGPPYGGFKSFDDTTTIATALRAGGYRTGFFGKYLDSFQSDALAGYVPPGWDRWVAFVHSEYFDYGLTIDGTVRRYGVEPEDYSTDVLAAETEDFIRESDGPVFALYAPPAPHDPAIPTGVDEGLFTDLPPWRPPSFNEPDVSDKPAHVQAMILARAGPHRAPRRAEAQPVPDAPGGRPGGRPIAASPRGHRPARRRAGDLHLGQRPALGRASVGEEGGPVRGGDPRPPRGPRRRDRRGCAANRRPPRGQHRPRPDDRGSGGRVRFRTSTAAACCRCWKGGPHRGATPS